MENLLFEDFVENTETEENVDLSQVEEINVEQGFEEATHVHCDNTLQMYFREIARIPLLNKEEETALFNAIEKGKEAKTRITLIETNDNDTTPIQEYEALLKVVEEANVAR
jgi:DNA-directed RNA polymerase sigma subunit (sigma70/sigma32)